MGYIRNTVLINVPVDDVFRLTNDVRTWPSLFTEYESSEVLEETDNSVTFRLTTCPDENGKQWSWVARRETNHERRSTYSERSSYAGPFEQMIIRWWYDPIDEKSSVMTWEQEFTMKPDATTTEAEAINYLNKQTRIQQRIIKARVEQMCGQDSLNSVYRGVIVGRYRRGSDDEIVEAFRRSDATELPHLLGIKSRHIWVLDDIYMHFVEGQVSLPQVLKNYSNHPLFREIKAAVDANVTPLAPEFSPGIARELYRWPQPRGEAAKDE